MDRRTFLQRGALGMLFAKLGSGRMFGSNTSEAAATGFGPVKCENIEATEEDIKIRFLGTGAAGWKEGTTTERRMSSVLVDDKFLIDFTLSAEDMMPSGVTPTDIIYTHSHGDHYQPERAVLLGIKTVYVSETWSARCKSNFQKAATSLGKTCPAIVPIKLFEPFVLHGITITPLPANHATSYKDEQSHIYLLEKGSTGSNLGVRLIYATDTGGIMGLASKEAGFDSHVTPGKPITGLIMEATMGINHDEDFRIFNHSSAKTVSRIANMLIATNRYFPAPGQPVYITHMAYSLHDKLSQSQLNSVLPVPLRAAYDGLVAVFHPYKENWGYIPPIEPLALASTMILDKGRATNNMPEGFPSTSSTDGSTYRSAFQATAIDGVIYTNDATTSTLLSYPCVEVAGGTQYADVAKGTSSYGIARDDAGNLIMANDNNSDSPNQIIIYNHANKAESVVIDFTLPNPGKTNFISASGDVFSEEGGYVYYYPNGQYVVSMLHIQKGVLTEILQSNYLEVSGSNSYIIPTENNPQRFYYVVRNKGIYYYAAEDQGKIINYASTTAPLLNGTLGGAVFTLGGHEMIVYPSGSNYNGGFTIMDLSAETSNKVVLSQAPIGNVGLKGNTSYNCSFTTEKNGENSVLLYVYTLGNGYAVFNISMNGGGQTSIKKLQNISTSIYPNPFTNSIQVESETALGTVAIYDAAGMLLKKAEMGNEKSTLIDTSNLAKGIYIIRTRSFSERIVKK